MSVITTAQSDRADVSLEESRQYCTQLTRRQARNFYYGLKLLPEPKRSAMFALYAYMRLVDDIADEQDGRTLAQRHQALDAWGEATNTALGGHLPDGHPVWPAFIDMTRSHGVPAHVFHEVIAGQRQDLESPHFQTFAELRDYCYRVAGVVGVASIYVWGFEGGAETERLAVDRGIAFQLTNVLRDLREDGFRDRLYLPRQELSAAGLDEKDLQDSQGFRAFMEKQIARAQSYYDQSSPLDARINADSRPTLMAMTQIYHGLLEKMSVDPGCVLVRRISLSPLKKLRIAWRAARAR